MTEEKPRPLVAPLLFSLAILASGLYPAYIMYSLFKFRIVFEDLMADGALPAATVFILNHGHSVFVGLMALTLGMIVAMFAVKRMGLILLLGSVGILLNVGYGYLSYLALMMPVHLLYESMQ